MFRYLFVLAIAVSLVTCTAYAKETRCGWFVNPSPANAWLTDGQGEWLIGAQGGFQAQGDWPDISQWVTTNRNYGYGCACMVVTTNSAKKRIVTIHSAQGKSLSKCRVDKHLPNERKL